MWKRSFLMSLRVAAIAAVVTVGCSVLLGVAHYRFGGIPASVRVLSMLPLFVPGVLVATGLFTALLQLDKLGSPTVLAIADAAAGMPIVVVLLLAAFDSLGPALWFAASSLGAKARVIVTRVLLPELAVAMIAALVLAFAAAFDEVTFAVFLGSGRVSTLPSRMYAYLQFQADPTLTAVASTLFFVALICLVLSSLLMAGQRRRRKAGKDSPAPDGTISHAEATAELINR